MNRAFFLCLCMALGGVSAHGQNILMKDGKVIVSKGLRRQGDTIIATVEMPVATPGERPRTGELGYPLAQISKLDFPEPPQIKAAASLLTQGRSSDALAQIDPVVRFYESFRDAPGSWWADSALLKVQALLALKREKDAQPLIENIAALATDPETVRAAKVQIAASMTRRGDHPAALAIYESVLKESYRSDTLAAAAVNKGHSHLAKKEWEPALLAFLQIPVFYPEQKVLIPQSMLGAGKAYAGVNDLPRAKKALDELINTYSATPEAAQARAELERIARQEKALEDPK